MTIRTVKLYSVEALDLITGDIDVSDLLDRNDIMEAYEFPVTQFEAQRRRDEFNTIL